MEYSRQLVIQRIADGVITSFSIDETIPPTLAAGQSVPRSARAPGRGRPVEL